MKISELLEELGVIQGTHGDIDVTILGSDVQVRHNLILDEVHLQPARFEGFEDVNDYVSSLSTENGMLQDQLNQVYEQRNNLAVALALVTSEGPREAGYGIDEKGRTVVLVRLPSGRQISWHVHTLPWDAKHVLEPSQEPWDGTFLGHDPDWIQKGFFPEPELSEK